MVHRYAQKKSACSHYLWAFFLGSSALSSSCVKQKSIPEIIDNGQECSVIDDRILTADAFLKTGPGCTSKRPPNAPVLYAHFLEQSLAKEIGFEDVLYNKSGAVTCAPGPYLIEDGNRIDMNKNEWELISMPDYFVWHLDSEISLDETFFFTNQSGFPIKSQTIRLENKNDATVVLLPKSKFLPGVKYYIYMVLNTKEAHETWIQPIGVIARSQ